MVTGASSRPIQCHPESIFICTFSPGGAGPTMLGGAVFAGAGAGAAARVNPCATSNWWIALSSFKMASAWSCVIPSGLSGLSEATDSVLAGFAAGFAVFEAAWAGGAALGAAAAFAFDGAFCAPAIRLHSSANTPKRHIRSPLAFKSSVYSSDSDWNRTMVTAVSHGQHYPRLVRWGRWIFRNYREKHGISLAAVACYTFQASFLLVSPVPINSRSTDGGQYRQTFYPHERAHPGA